MRFPLRAQLFLPFGALSVAAVSIVAVTTALVAARDRQRESLERLESVIETLRTAQFPFTSTVLEQMHGLSGAEFVIENSTGEVTASTLNTDSAASLGELPVEGEQGGMTSRPEIHVGDDAYFAARVPLETGPTRGTLVVLLPVSAWRKISWEAAAPPLIAGAATSVAALLTAGWLAGRFTHRLRAIRHTVSRIALGEDEHLSTDGPDDELRDLAGAVNSMSDQLRQHERTIRQTERMRLMAQLSSGLAHQLRNASSGARLAIQLVRRRHPEVADRELEVAMTQLEVIEDHLKRLLSVGPVNQQARRPGSAETLLHSVEELALPVCRHAGVSLQFDAGNINGASLPDFEGVRSGLLNLVMNGVEAAGRGGSVCIEARQTGDMLRVTVSDSGAGPGPTIAERIFEPFVTTKPEGIGLGLSFVRRTVEAVGGSVEWDRGAAKTRFIVSLPVVGGVASRAPEQFRVEATSKVAD
jgi:signal transduction histidine kinase